MSTRHSMGWLGIALTASTVWIVAPLCGSEPGVPRDPLAAWREGVKIRAVSQAANRHTIHSYFNASPESPDGRRILFYASTTAEGHEGELRILDRASAKEEVLARNVTVEDAHRAACQQWISDGRRVVFHDVRNGQWLVAAIDTDTRQERVLVRDRQLGWGPAAGDLVPVYGCHWHPGEHRDLELVNVESGTVQTVVTAAAVKETYGEWVARAFGERTISVFFPILSPDRQRVFFKIATATEDNFRSPKASLRLGLVCYDLSQSQFLSLREKWGHPFWHPDSRTIVEAGNILIDSDQGTPRRIPGLPQFRGSHPSTSPDGKLLVTDTLLEAFGGSAGEWGIVVAPLDGGDYVIIHRFANDRGARSWRRSHPHPSFSPDGKRIYFNTNSSQWTRLFVAEARPG